MGRALVVVDYQNDFASPDGALSVRGGDALAPRINELMRSGDYDLVVATRDWHPPDHGSFTAQGGVWPVHCVQDTDGAQLHADVSRDFVARNRQQSFKLDVKVLGGRDCGQQDSFALRIPEFASGALE